MKNCYKMSWSSSRVSCGTIDFYAENDEEAKESAKRIIDFQKSIDPKGIAKIINLNRIDVCEETTAIKTS